MMQADFSIDDELRSGRSFASCVLPGYIDGKRNVHVFMENDGRLVSQDGSEFIMVPSGTVGDTTQTETSREDYKVTFGKALRLITEGHLKKIVISRIRLIPRQNESYDRIFNTLSDLYPNAFVYIYHHPMNGTWIGASPELLLRKSGDQYSTVALAGTLPMKDGLKPSQLPWDNKLMEEQQMVSDYIHGKLKRDSDHVQVSERTAVAAGQVAHLQTSFTFHSTKSIDEWAELLHPTPAVSGLPADTASRHIPLIENHERRFYTGYLGIKNASGDGCYFVNLRCMQVTSDYYQLYVGGGITADSEMEKEWSETEHKSGILLKAIIK